MANLGLQAVRLPAPAELYVIRHVKMTPILQFGKDSGTDRDLYMIEVARFDELPDDLQLPSCYFVCLLAWDAREVSPDEIGAVARKPISQGGVYFCTWGPDFNGKTEDVKESFTQKMIKKIDSVKGRFIYSQRMGIKRGKIAL